MRLTWRRKRSGHAHEVSHDEAVADLKALEQTKARLDKHDENPNDGYHTPFNSSAYPGLDI